MELAKITSKGQITLPIAIRRALCLKDGDKVAFVECGGKYVVENPTTLAFENVRRAFDGEADRLGLKDVDDVTAMVKGIRAGQRDKRQ
jgi:AbrB family looped-hinge helix DNA binding protein